MITYSQLFSNNKICWNINYNKYQQGCEEGSTGWFLLKMQTGAIIVETCMIFPDTLMTKINVP